MRNTYLFVLYEYDSNIILIQPMKARLEIELLRDFKDLHEHLLTRGLKPSCIRLENEASPVFQG